MSKNGKIRPSFYQPGKVLSSIHLMYCNFFLKKLLLPTKVLPTPDIASYIIVLISLSQNVQ